MEDIHGADDVEAYSDAELTGMLRPTSREATTSQHANANPGTSRGAETWLPGGCCDQIAQHEESENHTRQGGIVDHVQETSPVFELEGMRPADPNPCSSEPRLTSPGIPPNQGIRIIEVQEPPPAASAEPSRFLMSQQMKDETVRRTGTDYSSAETLVGGRTENNSMSAVERWQEDGGRRECSISLWEQEPPMERTGSNTSSQRWDRDSGEGSPLQGVAEIEQIEHLAPSRWARANWWAIQESRRRSAEETENRRRKKAATPAKRQSLLPLSTFSHVVEDAMDKMKTRMHKLRLGSVGRIESFVSNHSDDIDPAEASGHGKLVIADLRSAKTGSSNLSAGMDSISGRKDLQAHTGSAYSGACANSPIARVSPVGRGLPPSPSRKPLAGAADQSKGEQDADAASTLPGVASLRRALRSKLYGVSLFIVTLYVLFGEDIYILCDAPVKHDLVIFTLSTAAFVLYCLDLCARSVAESGYALSALFWLDVFATVSLVPSVIQVLGLTTHNPGFNESLSLMRSGRAATTGARLARFLRVVHFANRVMAEYSVHNGALKEAAQTIDRHLSRHVIMSVGAMLVILLGLSFVGETDSRTVLHRDLMVLNAAWTQAHGNVSLFAEFLEPFEAGLAEMDQYLLFLKLQDQRVLGEDDRILELRAYPKQWISYRTACSAAGSKAGGGGALQECEVHLDSKRESFASSTQNIILVASLLAVLAAIALVMSPAARVELLAPIERIIETLDQIALQPWKKLDIEEGGGGREQIQSVNAALKRVGNLLQLGFGEAGMRIISKRLFEGKIDFTRKGNVVYAIFGFCDIRNFTDCTEVLGGDIVHLVNNVAAQVHQAVIDNGGTPNKNIGDAFLLVWKPKGNALLEQVADASLRSNLSAMIEMQRCKALRRWEVRADVQARMPGFRVNMGFGLHYGWAIEGAIGSEHKIDASYLSSCVNLASRLEAATKQYGTPMLFSGELHDLFSHKVRNLCRLVDRVTVKGSNHPIMLWTYDAPQLYCRGGTIPDDTSVPKEASTEEFFDTFKPCTSEEFRSSWAKAISRYLGGVDGKQADWVKADAGFQRCLKLKPQDGPTLALLDVMRKLGVPRGDGKLVAPEEWPGYRALTEK